MTERRPMETPWGGNWETNHITLKPSDYIMNSGLNMPAADTWITFPKIPQHKEFSMRTTKTRTLGGWLSQAFITLDGKEVLVVERHYEDDELGEDNDPTEFFTDEVTSRLRDLFS